MNTTRKPENQKTTMLNQIKSNSSFTLWAADAQAISSQYSWDLIDRLQNWGVSSAAEDALRLWEGASRLPYGIGEWEDEHDFIPRSEALRLS